MLRQTVCRPLCFCAKPPSGAQDQILITVRHLPVCWCGPPSLTRGRVCRLQLLLVLASAVILGFDSPGTHDYILLSHSRLPQPGGPGPRVYIPQEQGDAVISPGIGFPFRRLLRLSGIRWRYSNPPPHRILTTSPCYISPARTTQKTSISLLLVLSLPEKRVYGAVP
jgi:hypothetical protein